MTQNLKRNAALTGTGGDSANRTNIDRFARQIADAMPALISYIDKDYRYRFVNRHYQEWFGNGATIIGKTMSQVLGPTAFEKLRQHVDAALAGERRSFESEISYKTAGTKHIHGVYTPDISPTGEVRGIFVLVSDITEQHEIELAVKTNEERYKAFISNSTEGIWRFELDSPIPVDLPVEEQVVLAYERGYLAECNDAMARQYGFSSAAEIEGMRLSDLLVIEDPKNQEFLRAFIQSGYKLSEAESHERDAEGRDRYFLNTFVGTIENGSLVRSWGTQRDITEARQTERATALLASIVVSTDDAVITKDLTGTITSWNDAAERIFGYSADEAIGQKITMLIPPDRMHEEEEILGKIGGGGRVEHYETIRRRKDGTLFDVSLTISPMRGRNGEIIGASKIARDITERKNSEDTLNQNRAILSLAMQSGQMGVWERDIATDTLWWSEELEAIFGLKPGEFRGTEQHYFDLIHEDDRQDVWNETSNAIAERRSYALEFRFYHRDGSIRWLEGRGEAVYSQKGEPVRLYGVGIDITERKKAEEAIRESAAKLRAVYDGTYEYIGLLTPDGTMIDVNRAALEFGDDPPEEIIGRPFWETMWWRNTPGAPEALREAIERAAKGEFIRYEAPLIRPDGETVTFDFSIHPVRDEKGNITYLVPEGRNVSDRVRADEALRKSEERYRTVLGSMDEGFFVAEIIFDKSGNQPIDIRILETNDAFYKQTDFPTNIIGRRMTEITGIDNVPAIEVFAEVATSGESQRFEFEMPNAPFTGWYDLFIQPLGEQPNRVAVIFHEITARKQAEIRREALIALSQRFGELDDPAELAYAAAETLGRTLAVSRAGYGTIDPEKETITIERDWNSPGIKSLAGVLHFRDYGTYIDDLKRGATVVFADAYKDPRTAATADALKAISAQSVVNMPITEYGGIVALLYLNHAEPREWTVDELDFIREVANRTRAVVERRRSDNALRESSEFNQDVIDSIPAHLAVVDDSGVITAVNKAWRQFALENGADWTMQGVGVGANYLNVCRAARGEHSNDATAISDGIESVLKRERTFFTIEYPCHAPTTERWFLLTVSPLTRGGAVISHQNITERRKAESAIRVSEEKYRQLANAMPQLVWTTDETGEVNYYNSLAEDRYGIVFDKAKGQWTWLDIIHPDDVEVTTKAWADAQTGTHYEVEHRMRNKEGHYRWHLSKASAIRDEATGQLVKWFGTATDIHDYKTAQQLLFKAERKAAQDYQLLLERIIPLGQTLGTARDLESVYRAMQEFISSSMACSGFFVSFYDPIDQVRIPAYVWGEGKEVDTDRLPCMPIAEKGGPNSKAILEKRTVITDDYWEEQKKRPHVVLMKNGKDPQSSIVVPMMVKDSVIGTLEVQAYEPNTFDLEQAIALEMVANLAAVAIENVRLINEKDEARKEAELANKTKDEFLSVLSHELRTPLNAILGWVRMYRLGIVDEEHYTQSIDVIERNANLQNGLIEDLLDVSRIISGKMRIEHEMLDVAQIARDVAENLSPVAIAKEIDLELSTSVQTLFIEGDHIRLQQALTNLIQNAIKFTPAGGSIRVSVRKSGENAEIRVADTGIGIDPAFVPFIFERFRQADASSQRQFSGLGLGLTIVRTIIELHGGTISVRSDGTGCGSTFTVLLPLAAEGSQTQVDRSGELIVDGRNLSGKRVLLVDDNYDNVLPLQMFLGLEGAEVATASSGAEALAKLAAEDFNLLISDIGMPEMDGFALISQLRKNANGRNSRIPAIAVTAYASSEDKKQTRTAGFQTHVSKPIDFAEVMKAISDVLDGGME